MNDTVLSRYRCPACGLTWAALWDAACDDDCPRCGKRHLTPYWSADVEYLEELVALGPNDAFTEN